MIIENIKKAQRIKAIYMLCPLIFTISLVVLILLDISWGFWVVMGIAILMVLLFLGLKLMQYNYLHCEIDHFKIVFKFYGLGPMNKEYKTIKIQPQSLKTFKIKSTMFGLVKNLVLTVIVQKNKIANYPPLSISGLSKKQEDELVIALNSLIKG